MANDQDGDLGSSKIWGVLVRADETPQAQPAAGPVRVALFRPSVTPALRETINEAKLFELWRGQFAADTTVSLVSQTKVDQARRKEAEGDYSFLRLKDAVRVSLVATHRKTSGAPQLVLTAHVEWKARNAKRKVSVTGSLARNVALLEQLATKVKQVIATGP